MRASTRVAARTSRVRPSLTPTRTAGSPSSPDDQLSEEQHKAQPEPRSKTSANQPTAASDDRLAEKKWKSWSLHSTSSPFPDFKHPTHRECEEAWRVLREMHQAAVDKEFTDPNTPETIPYVLDAMVVAILSQATSWSNAKRAMNSMKLVYGSVFAYDAIFTGGLEKLQETIRCGGLHVRKSKIILSMLQQVRDRYGKWSLDHLFDESDNESMKELMSYKGMGMKSASVVMSWCLKRNPFTVDTHVYRIAGLWKWRPESATREETQSHLNALIPKGLKFDLHFLLIQHGRTCPACRGGSKRNQNCEAYKAIVQNLSKQTEEGLR